MARTPKRKPPSRVRYEQGHPTVSCRVPREIYERLEAVKDAGGRSFADVLKVGLGILEVKVEKEAAIRRRGYVKGYQEGYAYAASLFTVTFPCSVCGQMIEVTSSNTKDAIRQYMQEHRWVHAECHGKRS